MHNAYVALGSNMAHEGAEGSALLARVVSALRDAHLFPRALSSVWETAAWPAGSAQADFVNAVVEIEAGDLTPQQLYERLSVIEVRFGRVRREKWAPRTLDLDIIAIDDLTGVFGAITLPHAHLHERAFVLAPLAEIAPDWLHPVLGKTAPELLADLAPGDRYRRVDDL